MFSDSSKGSKLITTLHRPVLPSYLCAAVFASVTVPHCHTSYHTGHDTDSPSSSPVNYIAGHHQQFQGGHDGHLERACARGRHGRLCHGQHSLLSSLLRLRLRRPSPRLSCLFSHILYSFSSVFLLQLLPTNQCSPLDGHAQTVTGTFECGKITNTLFRGKEQTFSKVAL